MKTVSGFEILDSLWAISPDALRRIESVIRNTSEPEALMVRSGAGGDAITPELRDNVAVLHLTGIMTKNPTFLGRLFGEVSTTGFGGAFSHAVRDPNVKAIVLVVDSPGGTVDGAETLAATISGARGQKPIVSVIDGIGASAAYWAASAADKVYVTGKTTQVGSIGVVAAHVDYSGALEQRGIKVTEITAGKYKRIASQYHALSDEGRATIQDQVDGIYTVFVDTVAKNRGVTPDAVLKKMADGRLFLGDEAIAAGLVDGIRSVDAAVSSARIAAITAKSTSVLVAAKPLAVPTAPKPVAPEPVPAAASLSPKDLADKATEFQTLLKRAGRTISTLEAIEIVESASRPDVPNPRVIALLALCEQQHSKERGITISPSRAVEIVRGRFAGGAA